MDFLSASFPAFPIVLFITSKEFPVNQILHHKTTADIILLDGLHHYKRLCKTRFHYHLLWSESYSRPVVRFGKVMTF